MTNEMLDEMLRTTLRTMHITEDPTERLDTDDLIDVLRHRELLEALVEHPLDRQDLEAELDISRATSHRFTRWLDDHGLARRVDNRFTLTGKGEVLADAVVDFERSVRAGDRLAPLLDAICEYHKEFVVRPFADAEVAVATPDDPHRPVARFVDLLDGSSSFRGFNTVHMVPPALVDLYGHLFDDVDTELIYLPAVVDNLLETYPDQVADAVDRESLALRTRETLPYGLAIFDDRVGIGGYNEETGLIEVFADSDSAVAMAWAEHVFESYRNHSEPLDVPPVSADESL